MTKNSRLTAPRHDGVPVVTLIPGDGVGPEVISAALEVIDGRPASRSIGIANPPARPRSNAMATPFRMS